MNRTILKLLFLTVLGGLAGYAMIGFYRCDPFVFVQQPLVSRMTVWGARIAIPLVFAAIAVVVLGYKSSGNSVANLALLAGTLVLMALLAYPFLNTLQHRAFRSDTLIHNYHPYLQLKPHPLPDDLAANQQDFRIFCLGGSTTEFKDSTGSGWPRRLQTLLQDHYATTTIKVYNFGRQWYTSLHTLIHFETNLRQYRPDMIIVMHAINDLLHNADFSYFSHGPFREDYGHFYGPINNILTHDQLERTTLKLLSRLWYFRPRAIVDQTEFPGLMPFARNLNTLIDLARTDGTQVVLMTQPSLYKPSVSAAEKALLYMLNFEAIGPRQKWSYASARKGFQDYNAAIVKVADQRGAYLIDLEQAIPKDLDNFSDDVHYRDQTFDRIAQFVSQAIIASGLIPAVH